MNVAYANYKRLSVSYDLDSNSFDAIIDGHGSVIRGAKLTRIREKSGLTRDISEYGAPKASFGHDQDSSALSVSMDGSHIPAQDLALQFRLSDDGLDIFIGGDGSANIFLEGELHWGEGAQSETMAVCLNRASGDLRCSSGPAADNRADALFDPATDEALEFETSAKFRIAYDWKREAYAFSLDTQGQDYARRLRVRRVKHVYEDALDFDYKRMNKDTAFPIPPVGWMSWYSVQFDAGEKTVLENARFQRDVLKSYGANAIWVDWEWYHRDFTGIGADDLDMFHPDPKSYPRALAPIAEEISAMGFTPALWVGPTCDPTRNEVIKEHPEVVLENKQLWCGQYLMDVTSPAFMDELLPKMLRQSVDWGYKAVKWDCLPTTLEETDRLHGKLADGSLSSREALLRAFRKGREVVGKDCYMLYCCAQTQRDIDMACAVFDGVRIGGDIFRWSEFIGEMVDKVYRYYALNNVVLRADPDNVILREKFNSIDQAVTRAAFVSLLGLPFTFGDELAKLPPERLEIIKRSIPPIPDARTMDIRSARRDGESVIINLAIERPFGRWHVLDVVNLSEKPRTVSVDVDRDAHLDAEDGPFEAFEFWGNEYLGQVSERLTLDMRPHESKIISLRAASEVPQVLSTSRHISHGAIDLIDVAWDADSAVLSGASKVVGGESYKLTVTGLNGRGPSYYSNHTCSTEVASIAPGVWQVEFHPESDGKFEWSIGYK